MRTNSLRLACFLLAGFVSLAISGVGGQEPDSPEARRKALEAERRKVTKRMAEIDVELEKLKSAGKPGDVVAIDGFLGIAADFSVYAKWEADGLVFAELDTNKKLPAPAWDRDWGLPCAVLFGAGFVAVPAGKESKTRTGQPVFTPADSVKVFSSKTLELERNIREFNSAAILADDGHVVAMVLAPPPSDDSDSRSLVLQDIAARKVISQMKGDRRPRLYSLDAAGKYVAFYQFSGNPGESLPRVSILNAQTGTVAAEIKAGPTARGLGISSNDPRLPLAVSPSGTLLAWPDDDVVIIYDVKAAKILHRLVGHLDALCSLSFSAAGDVLASSAKDKTVRFWNPTTGEPIRTIKHFPAVVTNVVLSPDGKRLLAVMGENRKSAEVRAEVRKIDLK